MSFILFSVSLFAIPKSNIENWPSKPFFFVLCIISTIPSKDASKVLLFCSNSSNAPAFIKLSMHFLLTLASAILSQKSVNDWNFPFFSLSSTILFIGSSPTFFMLPKPNLIFPFLAVNLSSLSFILGFKISIFKLLHSSIYTGTLSKFPK